MRVRDEWEWETVRSVLFFFLNFSHIGRFGLNRPFRRFRPISADTAWVGPIQRKSEPRRRDSAPRRRESAKKSKTPRGMTSSDIAGRAGSSVPRASPRPTEFDAGAAPPVPRPCFIGYIKHCRLSHQQIPRASSLCLELVLRAALGRSLKPTRSWWSCWNMHCSQLRCYFICFQLFKSLPGERHKRMNTKRKLKVRQNREYSKRSKVGFTGKPD